MNNNENVIKYLRSLKDQRFWGILSMKLEDGDIVHMRREENLKPSAIVNLPEKNRGNYDHDNS